MLISGDTQWPHDPYEPDFQTTSDKSTYWREYWSLYSNHPAGLALKSDETLGLDAKTYFNNNIIYKFNFDRYPHHGFVSSSYFSQRRVISQLDAHITFDATKITTPVTMLVFTSYREMMSIGRSASQERDVQIFYTL